VVVLGSTVDLQSHVLQEHGVGEITVSASGRTLSAISDGGLLSSPPQSAAAYVTRSSVKYKEFGSEEITLADYDGVTSSTSVVAVVDDTLLANTVTATSDANAIHADTSVISGNSNCDGAGVASSDLSVVYYDQPNDTPGYGHMAVAYQTAIAGEETTLHVVGSSSASAIASGQSADTSLLDLFNSLPVEAQQSIQEITDSGGVAVITIDDGSGGLKQVSFTSTSFQPAPQMMSLLKPPGRTTRVD
jgi:hypothetical protein